MVQRQLYKCDCSKNKLGLDFNSVMIVKVYVLEIPSRNPVISLEGVLFVPISNFDRLRFSSHPFKNGIANYWSLWEL